MKLNIKPYLEACQSWPENGHHIMAQYNKEEIIVYQSYRPEIGNFAVQNQFFGGEFRLSRMTWIKPNFLWMMYRNGWGQKEGQEVVLAIHLKVESFERYCQQAVYSSYQSHLYNSREQWQSEVENSEVRLQWDPDHDPYGQKLERRAIQIGIRGAEIENFAKSDIILIEDISDFVNEQYKHIQAKSLDKLMVPEEQPFLFSDPALNKRLRIG